MLIGYKVVFHVLIIIYTESFQIHEIDLFIKAIIKKKDLLIYFKGRQFFFSIFVGKLY